MKLARCNTWLGDLDDSECETFDRHWDEQKVITSTFKTLVAEVKAEHGRALHLVKATPRKIGS